MLQVEVWVESSKRVTVSETLKPLGHEEYVMLPVEAVMTARKRCRLTSYLTMAEALQVESTGVTEYDHTNGEPEPVKPGADGDHTGPKAVPFAGVCMFTNHRR
jgi:hypothetical protein